MASGSDAAPRPFIGRAEAIDQLRRRQDEARAGRGGLTVIVGEAGVGKSSLLRLVGAECAERGMAVLRGQPSPLEPSPPLQMIRDVLASGPSERPGRPEPELSPGSLASMVPTTPSSSMMIGFAAPSESWAARTGTGDDRLLEAVARRGGDPGSATTRTFQALTDEFRRLVERGPTAILLEDLHRADDASFEFLLYALPALARHPLWFVASSLPPAQTTEVRRGWFERLRREVGLDEVPLRPLTPQEVPELIRYLAPDRELAPEEFATWHAQSGGNPLFLERLVRGSIAGPSPGAPSTGADPGAPERALHGLPDPEARVLGYCAVLGHGFPFDLLWAATGDDEEALAEAVEGLVVRGILREGVDERLEFLREELRSRVYGALPDSERRALHREAGEALEKTGLADPATIYALALHCYVGRLDDRSALYNRTAGELAARQGSPTVARFHLERALESHRRARPDDVAGELEILLDLVVQLDRLGELREADRVLTEAFRRPAMFDAASPSQRALARLYRARLLTDQGRWGEADHLTRELLDSADVQLGPRTLLGAHRLRGELLYYQGEYAESLRHHEEAQRIARQLHDEREIALEAVRIANALATLPGRSEEAYASYRLAADTLVALGDLGEAAYAQLFLGVLESQHGRVLEGLRELDKALTLAEEGHDPRRTGWARFNLADLERERGNLDRARRHNARALAILTAVGDRFGLLQVHLVEGKIHDDASEHREAELELLEAYRLARELQAPADEVEILLRLAEVALGQGDPGRARARAEEAERIGLARRPELAREWDAVKARIAPGGDA